MQYRGSCHRILYVSAAVAAGVGVALGAFAAHGLKARLTPELLATFETGVRYQMYHAFALLAAGWGEARWGGRWFGAGGLCFVAGMLLFSGSLYLLAMTGARWLGMITPIGGLAFLAGWGCLAVGALRAAR